MSADHPLVVWGYLPFRWGFFIGVFALSLYYGDERSWLHRRMVEKVFWGWAYGWLAFILVWLPDSPIYVFAQSERLSFIRNVAAVLLAAYIGIKIQVNRESARKQSSVLQTSDLDQLVKPHAETVVGRIAAAKISGIPRSSCIIP